MSPWPNPQSNNASKPVTLRRKAGVGLLYRCESRRRSDTERRTHIVRHDGDRLRTHALNGVTAGSGRRLALHRSKRSFRIELLYPVKEPARADQDEGNRDAGRDRVGGDVDQEQGQKAQEGLDAGSSGCLRLRGWRRI